mmetsp:Transcript_6796/g.8097  ORF Transcript_6796/g.8097 Transcript_6796/m.8097 type:complete len:93 (+) Transcript_6796:202-480(+)
MRDSRSNVYLDTVIDNIEMLSDFYQRTTLTYRLGTQRPLFDILIKHNVLQPEPEPEVEEASATPTGETAAAQKEEQKTAGEEEEEEEASKQE